MKIEVSYIKFSDLLVRRYETWVWIYFYENRLINLIINNQISDIQFIVLFANFRNVHNYSDSAWVVF